MKTLKILVFLFASLMISALYAEEPTNSILVQVDPIHLSSLKQQGELFLKEYMPVHDRGVVSQTYLQQNLDYAILAFSQANWFKSVPDSIFLNDILPYSSIGEEVDAWRPLFYEKFEPLVRKARSTVEAAEILNREIWSMLSVTYSPQRDKPDQSPFHSMRIGKASCTGLSILLVDACRSVGIPARLAGCNWKHKPGNHSWAEIWDTDGWHHLGAEDAPLIDQAWFNADVIYADPFDPQYAIYASSWKPTGLFFYGTWNDSPQTSVPAYNVTERYLKSCHKDVQIPRLSISVVDSNAVRVMVPLYVVDKKTHQLIAHGTSYDDHYDLNRHFNIALPQGSEILIYGDKDCHNLLAEYRFGSADYLLLLTR